jgi:hypothetical protein
MEPFTTENIKWDKKMGEDSLNGQITHVNYRYYLIFK